MPETKELIAVRKKKATLIDILGEKVTAPVA